MPRDPRVHRRRHALAAAIAVLAALLLTGCSDTTARRQAAPTTAAAVAYTDPYVIDGDTLDAAGPDGQRDRIRILGINTPEDSPGSTECAGPAATAALRQILTAQQTIILVRDPTQPARDKYGRTLGYVGRALIDLGLAEELTIGRPHARQRDYRDAQQVAADAPGMWATC